MTCLFVDVMRSYKNFVTPGELQRDKLPKYNRFGTIKARALVSLT